MPFDRPPAPLLPPVGLTLVLAVVVRLWLPTPGMAWASAVALGLAAWHLLVRARAPQPERAAALLLLLPGVLLADDAMWAAAGLMALAAALDRKPREMLLWCGVALGLNALALTIVPLILALSIQRRVPARVGAHAALGLATMLALTHTMPTVPGRVTLTEGAPTLWAIAQGLPGIGTLPLVGLAACLATGLGAACVAWFSARPLHGRALIDAALLAVLTLAGAAPAVGPHAFLLADVLAPVAALSSRHPARWPIALLVQAGSLLALAGGPDGACVGAAAMLLATLLQARSVLVSAANDNPLMARMV